METRATMRPGQKGTKKLAARFGERLLFVRYRYDATRRQRFTTVELIVAQADWNPPPVSIVGVRVEVWESALQRKIRAAGGSWDRESKQWLLPADQVRKLGLDGRVVSAP